MRVVAVWFVLLILAICNGAFREFVLVPRVGAGAGHVISCVTLSALILAVTFATIRWLRPHRALRAIEIGAEWLAMTLVFEFGFGRIRGVGWDALLADYNVFRGRFWILVLITTVLAPLLMGRARGVFAPAGRRP